MFKRDFINSQKTIVVDGLPASGKALISELISGLPNVEQFRCDPTLEQVLALHKLKKIDRETSKEIIKSFHNRIIYETTIFRHSNFRKNDTTSILNHPRIKAMRERFGKDEKKIFSKYKNKIFIHYCLHMVSNIAEPLFEAFKSKLVFVVIFRSPLNLFMLKKIAYFLKQWEKIKSRDGHIKIYNKTFKKNIHHSIYKKKSNYFSSNYYEKAILLLNEFYDKKKINKIKFISKKYKSKTLFLSFEKLSSNPISFMKTVSTLIGTKLDKIFLNVLKKNKLPRKIDYENEKKICLKYLKSRVRKKYFNKLLQINSFYERNF